MLCQKYFYPHSSHPVNLPFFRIFRLLFAVSLWHIFAIGARRQGE